MHRWSVSLVQIVPWPTSCRKHTANLNLLISNCILAVLIEEHVNALHRFIQLFLSPPARCLLLPLRRFCTNFFCYCSMIRRKTTLFTSCTAANLGWISTAVHFSTVRNLIKIHCLFFWNGLQRCHGYCNSTCSVHVYLSQNFRTCDSYRTTSATTNWEKKIAARTYWLPLVLETG